MEEHVHIEVWSYNMLFSNEYVGYESLELISLVGDSVRQTVNIYDKMEKAGEGPLMCTLSFKLVIEEVWDFYLQFLDWRTSNIENTLKRGSINP